MRMGYEYTIKEFIDNYAIDDVTFNTVFLKDVFNTPNGKMIVNGSSVLDRYRNELSQYKTKLKLTSEEYRKYQYNPKVLSYDIYGTTEFWFLILHANELTSVAQFDMEQPYVYTGVIASIITSALNLEKDYIDYNEELKEKKLQS